MAEVVFLPQGIFICKCHFEERAIPKRAGFRWNAAEKVWFTKDVSVAKKLQDYLTPSARREIQTRAITVEPWLSGISPGFADLFDFQKEAVTFALSRNRSYLGLDPGLGKTACAAAILQSLKDFYNQNFYRSSFGGVYICPPFLVQNTKEEFSRWAPRVTTCAYRTEEAIERKDLLIVPDSILHRPITQADISRYVGFLKDKGKGTILFVDEAHRFKNIEAVRTKALFGMGVNPGIFKKFDKVVFLSGTPMPNRPIELFTVLSNAAPDTIEYMNKFAYGKKYCEAYEGPYGWDFSGASNVKELAERILGTFMLRKKKKDVLKSLPEKTEEVIVLDANMDTTHLEMTQNILAKHSPEDLMAGKIKAELEKDELYLSTYRRMLGIAKAPYCSEYIKWILEDTDENILVFAQHKEVIRILQEDLEKYEPLVITGDTKMEDRHAYVRDFQNPSGNRRLFIGNIQAMGTGFTLTMATRVVFAEFSWVPGDNEQASDRAHRIGQKENVLVQYLVYKNSVDKAIIETVLRKRKITAHV